MGSGSSFQFGALSLDISALQDGRITPICCYVKEFPRNDLNKMSELQESRCTCIAVVHAATGGRVVGPVDRKPKDTSIHLHLEKTPADLRANPLHHTHRPPEERVDWQHHHRLMPLPHGR